MNSLQWLKYQFYNFITFLFPKGMILLFSSSPKTEWFRNTFFRPMGMPEIYKKKIQYFHYTLYASCPLQILSKAEKKGIEPSLSRLIMNHLSPGDECIDIGSNYGFITMIMAKSVGVNGHVYSFESDQDIFQILLRNIKDNNIDNICSVENYFISNNNIGNNQKIDDLLLERSKKIKLIKIDTDGYDFECLCGSEQLIKQQFPLIIIEMTENNNKIHQKLINIGYQYFYNQHYKEILNINYPPNLIASVKPLQLIPID